VVSAAEQTIRQFVAAQHPDAAERVTDYVMTTMAGLSAKAREGQGLDRLLATARLAGRVLAEALRETGA
jgi:TetR/AcrR family transcriptional repressor for divergent bdcA